MTGRSVREDVATRRDHVRGHDVAAAFGRRLGGTLGVDAMLRARSLALLTRRGTRLAATGHGPLADGRPAVIFCHGFPGPRTEFGRFTRTAEALASRGIDALLFDFSGYGESERAPIRISHQIADLEDAYAWLKRRGCGPISTLGLSLGGLVATLADLPDRAAGVLWAPAFDPAGTLGRFAPLLERFHRKIWPGPARFPLVRGPALRVDPIFLEELRAVSVDERLAAAKEPLLVLHGQRDWVIPAADVARRWARFSAHPNRRLVVLEGAGHYFQGATLDRFIGPSVAFLDGATRPRPGRSS